MTDTPIQKVPEDDHELVRLAADLLYPPGDPRLTEHLNAGQLGQLRSRLRGLADELEEVTPPADQQITVEAVVNGWTYELPTTPTATLDQLVAAALAKGNHTGRPATDWEVRDVAGVWLDPYGSKTLEELNLHRGGPDTRLFLNLRAGAGG